MRFQYAEKINLRDKTMIIPLAYTRLTMTMKPTTAETFVILIREKMNQSLITENNIEIQTTGTIVYQGTPLGNYLTIITDYTKDIYIDIIGEI